MYSGTTFRVKSGRIMGVHQKIDRLARASLTRSLPRHEHFPRINQILHFEGLNGPDGVKRKSPGKDEPWHYLDPKDGLDHQLTEMVTDHLVNLTAALRDKNDARAAFEAAWLAHAITDGLTPAHHYPLEEKLEQLRAGQGLETRSTTKEKLVLPGKTRREQLRNNWEYWGTKGVMTTHLAFELGVATTIAGARIKNADPSGNDLVRVRDEGFLKLFEEAIQRVNALGMYEEFHRSGWTRRLARDTKVILIPEIAKTVALAWYVCAVASHDDPKERA